MLQFFEGEEVIFNHTFYNDRLKTDPVDPSSVDLYLEAPDGTEVTPIVSEDGTRPANEGKYIASHEVDQWGVWDWRWETASPRIVKQGKFLVIQNNQED